MRIRFREETGELIEWSAVPVVDPKVAAASDVVPRVSLRLGGAEYARIARRVDQDWGKLSYDPARRRSLADLVLHSDLAGQFSVTPASKRTFLETAAAVRLGERLFSAPGVRARLDGAQSPDDPDFPIPADPYIAEPPNTITQMLGLMLYEMSRVLDPPTTWPARLSRELSCMLSGQSGHTEAVLDDLYSDPDMGPVGSLVTAKLLRLFNSPDAWRFARRALERSSLSDFRVDCHNLLESDSPAARLMREMLPAIVSLSDEELGEIAAILSPSDAQLVRQVVTTLRSGKAEGAAAALRPLLETWWEREMRLGLSARLDGWLGHDGSAEPASTVAFANGLPVSRQLLELGRHKTDSLVALPSPLRTPVVIAPGQPPMEPTLDALATLTLVLPDAVRQGADVSDAAVDRQIEGVIRDQHHGDRAAFEATLARDGLSQADFRELSRLNQAAAWMRQNLERAVAPPTDDEISAAAAKGSAGESVSPDDRLHQRTRLIGELTEQKRRVAWEDYLNHLRATAFVYVVPAPVATAGQPAR